MAFNPKDHYFKKAKKEGYLARSAYKLEEIQKKYRVINPRDHVLDLGCAPGSWSQFILKILGKDGFLFGLDLKEVTLKAPNAKFLVADIFELPPEQFEGAPYDVVVSDMAPNTTGIAFTDQARSADLCRKVIEVADRFLKPGGHIVMKIFMGGEAKDIENEVKKRFQRVQMFRPDSVRKVSFEIYIVGIGKKKTV